MTGDLRSPVVLDLAILDAAGAVVGRGYIYGEFPPNAPTGEELRIDGEMHRFEGGVAVQASHEGLPIGSAAVIRTSGPAKSLNVVAHQIPPPPSD